MLNVAQIVPVTEAEGPGSRMAVWLQGCPLRCPGCCNPEMLSFHGGKAMSVAEILELADSSRIEGITLLGGEPTAQAAGAAELARAAQAQGLSIMVFSGFTLGELRAKQDADIDRLLSSTDILVDGPYMQEHPDTQRRWIGSTNQQIHFLTERYRSDDPCWQKSNTIELRLDTGGLTVNGFPARSISEFWRRPAKRM